MVLDADWTLAKRRAWCGGLAERGGANCGVLRLGGSLSSRPQSGLGCRKFQSVLAAFARHRCSLTVSFFKADTCNCALDAHARSYLLHSGNASGCSIGEELPDGGGGVRFKVGEMWILGESLNG